MSPNRTLKTILFLTMVLQAPVLFAAAKHATKDAESKDRYSDCRVVFPKGSQSCTVHCTDFFTMGLGNRIVCSAELVNPPADGVISLFSGAFSADKGPALASRLKEADKHAVECGCARAEIVNTIF